MTKNKSLVHIVFLWFFSQKLVSFFQHKNLVFLYFICACSNQSYNQPFSATYHNVIDLDAPRSEAIKASTLIKMVKTVILEENRQSLIGNVNKVQMFDEHLYVLDRSVANSLFVFDLDGKFIRRIGRIGRGPGEYARIADFTFDRDNKILYVLGDFRVIHKYRTDGTYIEQFNINVNQTNVHAIQYYDNALFAKVQPWNTSVDDCLLMKIDPKTGNVLGKYFKPSQHNKGWNEADTKASIFYYRLCGTPVYGDSFTDVFISLDGMVPVFSISSKNLATNKDIETIKQKKNISYPEYLSAFISLPKVHAISAYIEHKDFIQFSYWHGKVFFVLCDLKTGLIHNGIENDLLYSEGGNLLNLRYLDGKGAYEIIQPNAMEEFVKKIKDNELVSNLDKLDELKKLTEEANPVIFYYEFKDAE